MKRVLITGSSGFVGRHLTQAMKSQPQFQCITVDLHSADYNGDLTDSEFIDSLPDADIIVHLAAVQYLTKRRNRFRLDHYFHLNNFVSTKNLSDKYSKSDHFIFVGTSMMYKITHGEISEDADNFTLLNGPYAKSKVECYNYLSTQHLTRKLAVLVPTIISGPGRGGFFSILNLLINKFRLFPSFRSELIQTGVVQVEDFCDLIIKVIINKGSGIFNAETARGSFNEWAEILMRKKFLAVKTPKALVHFVNFIFFKQIFSKEQIVLLFNEHILKTSRSRAIGWAPKRSLNSTVNQSVLQTKKG